MTDEIVLDRQATDQIPAEMLLGPLLRLTAQSYGTAVDAALTGAGFDSIRPAHANVLPFLEPEGTSVTQLARRARVRKQSMAQSVEQLERLGYVERRPDPADGRARLVFATERGRAIRPLAVATGREVEAGWAQLVGAERIEQLRSILVDLLNAQQPD